MHNTGDWRLGPHKNERNFPTEAQKQIFSLHLLKGFLCQCNGAPVQWKLEKTQALGEMSLLIFQLNDYRKQHNTIVDFWEKLKI